MNRGFVLELYTNFKKVKGCTLFMDLMMSATKEAYYEAHVVKMLQLKEVSLKAYKWLEVIPKQKWCKHGLSFYSKCDALMNKS